MNKYKMIEIDENKFEDVYNIMDEAFPIDEHRKKENQKKLLKNKSYKIHGLYDDKKIIAFVASWELEKFIFIEHFAVHKDYRNKKIGENLLKTFLGLKNKNIILEVEPPLNDLKIRRINFYKRCGFCLNNYEYMQPSYEKKQKQIPLKIMSYPKKIYKNEFIEELYKKVYNS